MSTLWKNAVEQGTEESLKGQTWYHGTPVCGLQPGDMLTPREKHERNFKQSRPGVVSLTTEHDTALHWARKAADTKGLDHVHVYEVEPVGPMKVHRVRDTAFGTRTAYEEVEAPQARVVRKVFGDGVDELPGWQGNPNMPEHLRPSWTYLRDPQMGSWVRSS
jgi:hypothetical protein